MGREGRVSRVCWVDSSDFTVHSPSFPPLAPSPILDLLLLALAGTFALVEDGHFASSTHTKQCA